MLKSGVFLVIYWHFQQVP